MGLLILFGIGAAIGTGAAFLMPARGHRIFYPYIVGGIVGALLGGLVLADTLGREPSGPGDLDAGVLLFAAIGAMLLLVVMRAAGSILGYDRS